MNRCFVCLGFALWMGTVGAAKGDGIPKSAGQIVVAVADSWDSTTGRLQCYQRTASGWKPAFPKPIAVLFGRSGLAWGRGVAGQGEKGVHKREGDRRAPAGVFRIGKVYGYDARLSVNPRYPYRQVGEFDAWPDDPKNPYYNRHIVVDPRRVPTWFESQKMRHGDDAYRWLVEIRHNSDPPKAGHGSAIFFHTRRGPTRATAGCTTMSRSDLLRFIGWLNAKARPHYVLLPAAEYRKKMRTWGLPPQP